MWHVLFFRSAIPEDVTARAILSTDFNLASNKLIKRTSLCLQGIEENILPSLIVMLDIMSSKAFF